MGNCLATSVLAVCWCRFCCSAETLAGKFAFVPPRPHHYVVVTGEEDEGEGREGRDARAGGGAAPGPRANRVAKVVLAPELAAEPYFQRAVLGASVTALTTRRGSTIPFFMIPYSRHGLPVGTTPTILFSHGNATDCVLSLPLLHEMSRRLHANVVTYDYTGYGGVRRAGAAMDAELRRIRGDAAGAGGPGAGVRAADVGELEVGGEAPADEPLRGDERRTAFDEVGAEPSVADTRADIDAAWAHLVDDLGVPPATVVVYGQSIGTGPSCYLCERLSRRAGASPSSAPRGLVLHSPLASGLRVIGGSDGACAPANALSLCDVFRNVDLVGDIDCPVMVIHGAEDEEIHVSHAMLILASVRPERSYPAWIVPGLGHNDIIEQATEEYFRRLAEFVRHAMAGAGDGPPTRPPPAGHG